MSGAYVMPFEWPLVEFERRIGAVRELAASQGVDVTEALEGLNAQARSWRDRLYSNLDATQRIQLARHPRRPTARDYIGLVLEDFYELRGDRQGMDDAAIVGGIGRFLGQSVVVIGHQKGRDVHERRLCRSGMPQPEGYRKAVRLMRHASRFDMPLLCFIDTPGAYPGAEAERHNQGGAIAQAIFDMAALTVPIISVVIGEGGSGGALALGVADRLLMLENSYYSVISPEGCAAILWKSVTQASEAARQLRLSAVDCRELGVADEVIDEPAGGAHSDPAAAARLLSDALARHFSALLSQSPTDLLHARYAKYRHLGFFSEVQE